MLVSANVESLDDPILAMIAAVNGNSPKTRELRPGVYEVGHFGSSHFPAHGWGSHPEFGQLHPGTYRSEYGVCDSIEQVLALFPELEAPGREFIVTLTPVLRANQSPDCGWRWHKWGPYIGAYKPKHEYLYDEDIDKVFVYRIYERQ